MLTNFRVRNVSKRPSVAGVHFFLLHACTSEACLQTSWKKRPLSLEEWHK